MPLRYDIDFNGRRIVADWPTLQRARTMVTVVTEVIERDDGIKRFVAEAEPEAPAPRHAAGRSPSSGSRSGWRCCVSTTATSAAASSAASSVDHGRTERLAAGRPRWVVGVDAVAFDDSQPTVPGVPGRCYWNPERNREARVFTGPSTEQRPWDASLRVGLGSSIEVDNNGNQTRGEPDFWALTAGLDIGASARWQLAVGGGRLGWRLRRHPRRHRLLAPLRDAELQSLVPAWYA